MIEFLSPWYLALLVFVPLHLIWRQFLRKRGARFIKYSSLEWVQGLKPTWRIRGAKSRYWIKLVAFVLFALALGRPVLLNQVDLIKQEGIDILLCLDVSDSMKSLDFEPYSRLEVAKQVIHDFIARRLHDRIGLVLFAGNSFTKCPLTVDYGILRHGLEEAQPGGLEGGTALGMALATSVNRIRHSKARTRVIIFLTDGVNNTGEIDPLDAIRIAKDYQVKVYTVGVGKRGEARVPVYNAMSARVEYYMQEVVIDEDILKKIANDTGGLYFRATDPQSLVQIFAEIDRWERSEVSSKKIIVKQDLALYIIILAFILLCLVEIGTRSFWRVLP